MWRKAGQVFLRKREAVSCQPEIRSPLTSHGFPLTLKAASCWLAVLLWTAGCAAPRERLYAPSSMLPHTTPAMRTAGYWIGVHPYPDRMMLNSDQVKDLNQTIEDAGLVKDLSQWPEQYDGRLLMETLSSGLDAIRRRGLMLLDGAPVGEAFWTTMDAAQNAGEAPSHIPRRYAIIVRYAHQRILPTENGLYAKAFDEDFDELQNSALDIGTPVVVLHESADGEWVYVAAALSDGWVRSGTIATITDGEFERWQEARFVVVTDPKADVFRDVALRDYHGYARMGARFPVLGWRDGVAEIWLPVKKADGTAALISGFIGGTQVHEGYLDYTPRTVLTQAFKMLHQPYGWGGMYGEQDCSRFLQEIFAPVGIYMPRNSGQQIQTGVDLARGSSFETAQEKLTVLQTKAIGGATLLGMRGHIMLYVGEVDGRPYAIHAVWAYRQPVGAKDDMYVLNRVTLSDLTLGEGSRKGSLLDRLNAIRFLGPHHE